MRETGTVAPELDLGVALEIDFADQSVGLAADVWRNGDALAQYRFSSQWRSCSLCPLREARIRLAIGIENTYRLASSREQLLEQCDPPEARELCDGAAQSCRRPRE